jgi:hypothetical protein
MTGTVLVFRDNLTRRKRRDQEGKQADDLSEMFTVRNMYIEKQRIIFFVMARRSLVKGDWVMMKYVQWQHMEQMPLSEYTGLLNGEKNYDHQNLFGRTSKIP